MNEELLVGELAKAAGVTADTIRFYEKYGILPEPARTGAGYRLYDRRTLQRVSFIRKAQAIGSGKRAKLLTTQPQSGNP